MKTVFEDSSANQQLNQRRAQIADMIRDKGIVLVEDLAAIFGVAAQTIRRDLNFLCERGMGRRVHGGVQRISSAGNTAYSWRKILHAEAKQAIARTVSTHVPNRVSLSFSIGTTPELVSRALVRHEHLKIFTNNLNIAMAMSGHASWEVTIAGGRIRQEDLDILGPGMEELFRAYKVDIGIYGVGGVDGDGTLLDYYEEEVRARQIIQENSRQTYIVLDHSKFGRSAHVRGGHLTQATKVFCDQTPPRAICDLLEYSGTELVVCSPDRPPAMMDSTRSEKVQPKKTKPKKSSEVNPHEPH